MDDKQKLFRLLKRLNTDPTRGQITSKERPEPAPRLASHRGSRQPAGMDTLEAKLRAQMLDGDAAVLNLADDSDDNLLTEVAPLKSFPALPCSLFSSSFSNVTSVLQEQCLRRLQPLGFARLKQHV